MNANRPKLLTVGIWTAAALGAVSLLTGVVNPLSGPIGVAFFGAVAWGLSRGNSWAGYGAALCLVLGGAVSVARAETAALSARVWLIVFDVALAGLLFAAGRAAENTMGRRSGQPWPWIAAAATYSVWAFCFHVFSIPTGAMEDTILVGDRLLVRQAMIGDPRHGDLVVLSYPVDRRQMFLKRVIGVPGDRVRIVNKKVLLNGTPLSEPWAVNKTEYVDSYRDNFPSPPTLQLYDSGQQMLDNHVSNGELIVPVGKYFVLGDNRDSSLDSRYWGFVDRNDIVARPVMVLSSFDDKAGTPRLNRYLRALR